MAVLDIITADLSMKADIFDALVGDQLIVVTHLVALDILISPAIGNPLENVRVT